MVVTSEIRCSTDFEGQMLDLTSKLSDVVRESLVKDGVLVAFVVGSTAAITTIEYEPGLQKDVPAALERIAPQDAVYDHEATWNDDNGHSHVRASFIGPSLTVPIVGGELTLGTWQQVVLLELDTRPRERTVVAQILGE